MQQVDLRNLQDWSSGLFAFRKKTSKIPLPKTPIIAIAEQYHGIFDEYMSDFIFGPDLHGIEELFWLF